MAAIVHGNVGRRATAIDRKVVFKSVLENPFKVFWPNVTLSVQNAALACLVLMLTGVAEYHLARQVASRKRKRACHDKDRKEKANTKKKRKIDKANAIKGANVENNDTGTMEKNTVIGQSRRELEDDGGNPRKKRKVGTENTAVEGTTAEREDNGVLDGSIVVEVSQMDIDVEPPLRPPPPIFSHLTFGINEVTKRLEAQSHSLRLRASVPPSSSTTPAALPSESDSDPPLLTHVFVCRADVDPPILIAHLPELVAACNAPSPAKPFTPVRLIPLPKYAEHTLADAIGLPRVSVLALDSTTPSLATLASLLSFVQPPSAPWLTATISHVPTHIKQLRTTAPHDMRAAKRERTEGRQAAKEKKNETDKSKKGKAHKEKKKIKLGASASASQKDPLSA